jgi:hypothetical protein
LRSRLPGSLALSGIHLWDASVVFVLAYPTLEELQYGSPYL